MKGTAKNMMLMSGLTETLDRRTVGVGIVMY